MGAEAVVKGESKRSNETMTTATTAMLELKIWLNCQQQQQKAKIAKRRVAKC